MSRSIKICSVINCEKRCKGHGFCLQHYDLFKRGKDPHTHIISFRRIKHLNSLTEIFESSIEQITESGCWIWGKSIDKDGYGILQWAGKVKKAHRLSYERFKGEIPKGLHICHKCDIPSCVNPSHLFLGTDLDNNRDMIKKGRARHPAGEDHIGSKLTKVQVVRIKELLSHGIAQTEIGKMFNVSPGAIGNIKFNRTWKHV